MKIRGCVLACVAALVLVSRAVAQEVSWYGGAKAEWAEAQIGESAWQISPIIVDGELVALFGVLDAALGKGENLRVIWAQPDASGEWSVHGWRHGSPERAASWLRKFYTDDSILGNTVFESGVVTTTSGGPETPEAVMFGVLESDPSMPLLAAAKDPELADTLVSEGAAGAIALSSAMLSASNCLEISEFDVQISVVAMGMTQSLNVVASNDMDAALTRGVGANWQSQTTLAAICWPCFPSCWRFWGAWTAWSCTGGPTVIAGGGCRYTGCTRSRTGTKVCVSISCATTTTPIAQTQGPQNKTCNDSPPNSGNCAAQPPAGC